MRFCSACGNPVTRQQPLGDDRLRAVCRACGTVHYVNPKIVVGSVCTSDDRLLLCRRAIAPREGYWTIPAGYMETGETAEEGAVREALEEANAHIEIQGLMAVYSVKRIDQVQLIYRARLVDPNVAAGPESAEVRLLRWHEIPWNDLAFPTVRWALRRAQELRARHGPIITVGNPQNAEPEPLPP
jgi:ADP-ribose pyrophosphatase YjhB (NUDIX family)